MNSLKRLPEFTRFVLVGVIATTLHYGIYFLLMHFIAAGLAYSVGYVISFIANFYLTAYFTFRRRPSWKKAAGFGGAHLCNYLLHMVLFTAFLQLGCPKVLAPVPVFAIAIPVNFLLVRFVFKGRKETVR